MSEEVWNEVDSMLNMGVIRPSTSSYVSAIIMLKKKDGSKGMCFCLLKVKITEVDPEPMMTAEDLFRRLGGKKYLSNIDLSKGYWQQIPVAPGDMHKTAFVTPDGQHEF